MNDRFRYIEYIDGSRAVEWRGDDGQRYGAKFYGPSASERASQYLNAVKAHYERQEDYDNPRLTFVYSHD